MHIIAIASQKGGAGKSTFAVNLAALADRQEAPALLIDTDPQGSLSVWHNLRPPGTPLLVPCRASEIDEVLHAARRDAAIKWVFIDGPPQNNDDIGAMMRAATLVLIPTRAALFDLASVAATIDMARQFRRPFFVALNAVPPRRGIVDPPATIAARKKIRSYGAPLWRGAIAHRAAYAHALATGAAVTEFESDGPAAHEMRALWRDVRQAALATSAYGSR
jgi:chromosome partitioning protein